MEKKSKKKLVIVLGSHRSGTSLLTAAIESLGAHAGIINGYVSDENPKGFFENEEIVHFNDRFLEFLGGRWDNPVFDGCQAMELRSDNELSPWGNEAKEIFLSQYGAQNFIVIKDPRMCQLLPFWNKVFNQCGFDESNIYYVHIARHPVEVAQSQCKRRKTNPEFYVLGDDFIEMVILWFSLTYQSLRDITFDHNIFLLYVDLVKEPKNQLIRLAKFLDVKCSGKEVECFCSNFVDESLRRNIVESKQTSVLKKEFPDAMELYEQIESLALKDLFHRSDIQSILKIGQRPRYLRHLIKALIPLVSRLENERYESNLNVKKIAEDLSQVTTERDSQLGELSKSRNLQQELQSKYEQVLVDEGRTADELSKSRSLQQELQSKYEQVLVDADSVTGELTEARNLQQELQSKYEQVLVDEGRTADELTEARNLQQELQSKYEQVLVDADSVTGELTEAKNLQQELQSKYEQVLVDADSVTGELTEARNLQQELQSKYEQVLIDEGRTAGELSETRKLQQELQSKYEQVLIDEERTAGELSEYQALYQNAISERDDRQRSYEELHRAHNRAVAERDDLYPQLMVVLNSNSWRLTRGPRAVRRYLITMPAEALSRFIYSMLRGAWVRLPIGPQMKSRLKRQLFIRLPFFFQRTAAYQNWKTLEPRNSNLESDHSLQAKSQRNDLSVDEKELYVPLSDEGGVADLPVQLIAFYLPQFHAIPENNEWWGEGFTEWTNVKPAKPQFEGHYQPYVPGELGYYDLTDPSVQKRQIELAKQFGVGGFCFYFYWFAGKRLLETPILNYLNDSSLDQPFCICWANENWSRRWDGLESDILMTQQHSPEDDFAFIEYVSRYLRAPRNIQINGRPLLLVYRPSLLPSPEETAQRWRTWCRENGIGEIYLAYTQSFETENPAKYGFDAAIEFPPNNSAPPVITDQVEDPNPEFTGIVYDWRVFVERSKNYRQPDYTLFRSVTPSWDNTARRKTDGAIFANSSPEGYQAWLTRAIENTVAHRENQDERLVFVNAWNEWAEGAYLEPDEKYGYAYLQATKDALEHVIEERKKRRIVLVAHDAYLHGAQYLILNMAKVLQESMGFIVDMIVLGEGPLISEYAKYANVHELAGIDPQGEKTESLVQKLFEQGATSAIANTTVTGLIVPVLKKLGFTVVSLIHELPQLIKDYKLHEHVKAIVKNADKIVFAATPVMKGFESFEKLDKTKVVIRPQGLYKKNSLQSSEKIKSARSELRLRFNLPEEAVIILGVGFADYRKGIDIFVESGIEICKKNKNAYFIWLGGFESKIEEKVKKVVKDSGLAERFIFPGLDYDSDIYYAGSDIYALTSREDPFPSVLMEALDVYTPVVAFTESGGAVELLSRGGGVLVDHMSSKAFSSALSELIGNPDKIYKLGQQGKQIIDEEFSFRKYLYDLADFANTGLRRVSVVIPNYNYEQFIGDRLQSVFDQSYPIYEIIILDDASTDNSVSAIEEIIKDQRIDCKFIANLNNSGNVFKQWAKGVEISSGDYVWIAEADDLSDAEFLNEVLKGFEDQDVVLSYCESKQMDSTGNVLCNNYLDYVSDISQEKWLYDYKEKGINEIIGSLAIKNTIPNASAVVFKREIISKVFNDKIDEIKQYRNAGDWIVYIYVLSNGDIAYSSNALNNHRRHDSSVTISSFDINQLEEILAVQKKVKELYPVDSSVVTKANGYSQVLYEQFGLSTNEARKITDNQRLNKYLT